MVERQKLDQKRQEEVAEYMTGLVKSGGKINNFRRNSRDSGSDRPTTGTSTAKLQTFILKDINNELKSRLGEDIELTPEDLKEFKVNGLPKKPSFPYGIFMLALAKDFVDLISLGLIGTFTNIIAFIFIRLYLMGKVGFIKRWLYKKYIFALVLETIPWFNTIPQWTIFILRAHAKENKAIDELLTSIERLAFRRGR